MSDNQAESYSQYDDAQRRYADLHNRGLPITDTYAIILGVEVPVGLPTGLTPQETDTVLRELDAAVTHLNANGSSLTDADVAMLRNLGGITLNEGPTGVPEGTRVYNIAPSYITLPASTTPWMASTFVHEGQHIDQGRRGFKWSGDKVAMQQEADFVQIAVGFTLGLTPTQIDYLRAAHLQLLGP